MKSAFTLTILVLASFVAEAQRLKSRLTLKTGETTEGYIIDTHDDWTAKTIAFSTTPTDTPKDIPISEIKELYLEQLRSTYQGELLSRDTKSVELSTLEQNGEMHMVKEFILVERLAQGPLSLFRYKDNGENKGKVHYFIQKEGEAIEALLYVRYVSMPNQYIVERPFYVSRLEQFKKECPVIKGKIPELQDAALLKFVSAYNSCKSGTAETKIKKYNTALTSFGLRGGIAGGSANFSGDDLFGPPPAGAAMSNGKYDRPITPLAELAVEFGMRRFNSRSRLGVYAAWHQTGKATHPATASLYIYEYTLDIKMLSFGLRYTHLLSSTPVKPFLRASLEASALLSADATRVRHEISTGVVTTAKFNDFRGFAAGFTAGAGVRFKGMELEARIHGSVVPSGTHASTTGILGPELILGYYIRQ